MPSNTETAEVFDALVINGLDFIERSAGELENAPKFSIAHFATGLELLLKARLFSEHWSLTASDPHSCSWTSLKDGSAHTVQASDLCATITTATGTSLQHSKTAFLAVFAHRNRTLHWIPTSDIETSAAEQCRAWYLLHQLLTTTWATHFDKFKNRINAVDKSLLVYQTYLKTRFKELENKLKSPQSKGALFSCPACSFNAGIINNPKELLSRFECLVCLANGIAGRFNCMQWHTLESLSVDCSCGEEHTRDELLEELDPASRMSPKDQSIAGQTLYSCGECLGQQTIAPIDGKGDSGIYICTACGIEFSTADSTSCEYCSELWMGYNTEDTSWHGCEFCDGPSFRDD